MITILLHATSKLSAIFTGLKAFLTLRHIARPSKEDRKTLRRIQEEGIDEGRSEIEKDLTALNYKSRQALLKLCEAGIYGYSAYALATDQVYTPGPYLIAAYAGYDLTKQLGNAYKATREANSAIDLPRNPTP